MNFSFGKSKKLIGLACRVEGVKRDKGRAGLRGNEERLRLSASSRSIINHLLGSGLHAEVGWRARCPGTARKEGTI